MTYCTVADIKNTTRNKALAAESTVVLTSLIEQAELIIDEYIGFVPSPSSQSLKFPGIGDTGIIPQVKYATIYQVEYMYERSPDIDHGITDENGKQNTAGNRYNVLSHRAKHVLRNIRQIVGKPFTVPTNNYDVTI